MQLSIRMQAVADMVTPEEKWRMSVRITDMYRFI